MTIGTTVNQGERATYSVWSDAGAVVEATADDVINAFTVLLKPTSSVSGSPDIVAHSTTALRHA